MPCAPWHMLHCWTAIVAPRPIGVARAARAPSSLAARRWSPALDAWRRRRSRAPIRGHARGAADAVPDALGREIALHRRQPDEADEEGATVSTTQRDDAPAKPGIAPRVQAGLRITAPDGNRRHRRLLQRRELRDRVAVVHDRERRSSSRPTGRSCSARRRALAGVRGEAEGEGRRRARPSRRARARM